MKLIGSIVAISAVLLLRAFTTISSSAEPFDETRLKWMIILHVTFIASGVLFAVMDWVSNMTDAHMDKLEAPGLTN